MGCYISYSKEGPRRAAAPPKPLLAVPNVTAHPSTASTTNDYLVILDMQFKLSKLELRTKTAKKTLCAL